MADDAADKQAKVERLHAAIMEGMDDIAAGRVYTREESDRNFAEFKARALAEYRSRKSDEE